MKLCPSMICSISPSDRALRSVFLGRSRRICPFLFSMPPLLHRFIYITKIGVHAQGLLKLRPLISFSYILNTLNQLHLTTFCVIEKCAPFNILFYLARPICQNSWIRLTSFTLWGKIGCWLNTLVSNPLRSIHFHKKSSLRFASCFHLRKLAFGYGYFTD